jgi:outer membrane protein assembly factor BamB
VSSFFTPTNQSALNGSDGDLGAGGAAILVDQPSATVPRLVVGGGKEGKLYVLNRDNLGGSGDSHAVQTFSIGNGIFSTAAFWQNTLYIAAMQGHLQAFSLKATSGMFTTSSNSISAEAYGFPGATPSVSSQGTSNGIVWALERPNPVAAAILHAYDATNLGTELWNTNNNAADHAGVDVKFTVPTIANGKVYVGTATEISVYGLSPN